MVEFNRDFFIKDPVLRQLYEVIIRNHKVAEHTKRTLLQNKHTKDFCVQSRHFVVMPGETSSLYIHYDVASWYSKGAAIIKIDSIGVYDDTIEFNIAKSKITEGSSLN